MDPRKGEAFGEHPWRDPELTRRTTMLWIDSFDQ